VLKETRLKKAIYTGVRDFALILLEEPAERCPELIARLACVENCTIAKAKNKIANCETFYISRPVAPPILCHTVQCFVQARTPQTDYVSVHFPVPKMQNNWEPSAHRATSAEGGDWTCRNRKE